jgi:HD-like signal output (HDOD) protein
VLALGASADFAELLKQQRETNRPMYELEREKLGTTHAEIGAFLLGSWGLPLTLVEAVAYHHMPQCGLGTDRSCAVLAAVHAADALMDRTKYQQADPQRDHKLDLAFIEQCGLTPQLPRWRELAAKLADS